MLQAEAKIAELRAFMDTLYNKSGRAEDLAKLSDADILEMASNLTTGVPFATPVFDGASEEDIMTTLQLAYPADIAQAKGLTATRTQAQLYDGRKGDAFERTTTVGYMHFLKLHHLVADQIHARSTRPYIQITQQTLAGKAQFGSQLFCRREVLPREAPHTPAIV